MSCTASARRLPLRAGISIRDDRTLTTAYSMSTKSALRTMSRTTARTSIGIPSVTAAPAPVNDNIVVLETDPSSGDPHARDPRIQAPEGSRRAHLVRHERAQVLRRRVQG